MFYSWPISASFKMPRLTKGWTPTFGFRFLFRTELPGKRKLTKCTKHTPGCRLGLGTPLPRSDAPHLYWRQNSRAGRPSDALGCKFVYQEGRCSSAQESQVHSCRVMHVERANSAAQMVLKWQPGCWFCVSMMPKNITQMKATLQLQQTDEINRLTIYKSAVPSQWR